MHDTSDASSYRHQDIYPGRVESWGEVVTKRAEPVLRVPWTCCRAPAAGHAHGNDAGFSCSRACDALCRALSAPARRGTVKMPHTL
jgi:hypothetical protein